MNFFVITVIKQRVIVTFETQESYKTALQTDHIE